jgi:hypothetical protein
LCFAAITVSLGLHRLQIADSPRAQLGPQRLIGLGQRHLDGNGKLAERVAHVVQPISDSVARCQAFS